MKARPRGRPKGYRGAAAVLEPGQVRQLLRAAARTRHARRAEIALLLSIELGLRASELAALCLSDVFDGDGRVRPVIRVPWAGATRCVPMRSDALRTRLADYRALEVSEFGRAGWPLLPSQRGHHMSASSMQRYLTTLYRAANIAGGSSRSGRRTFVAGLLMLGLNDLEIR
ncbi:MAG: tyrosine-type recombinase/integrase [Pseudomonadota bacterium]|jgi:integrase/recombinase XerD